MVRRHLQSFAVAYHRFSVAVTEPSLYSWCSLSAKSEGNCTYTSSSSLLIDPMSVAQGSAAWTAVKWALLRAPARTASRSAIAATMAA
jgi:hypothetical protein